MIDTIAENTPETLLIDDSGEDNGENWIRLERVSGGVSLDKYCPWDCEMTYDCAQAMFMWLGTVVASRRFGPPTSPENPDPPVIHPPTQLTT